VITYSEIEQSLRISASTLPPNSTLVVALAPLERVAVVRAHVARIVLGRKSECWYRLVWPGTKLGVFVHGVAPADVEQFCVRLWSVPDAPRTTDESEPSPKRQPWRQLPFELPRTFDREDGFDGMFDHDPVTAPPGWPGRVLFEKGHAHVRSRPFNSLAHHLNSRHQARIRSERREIYRARDAEAARRSMQRDVEYNARKRDLEREREAAAAVERMRAPA